MTNPYPVLHLEHAWQLAYEWVCKRRRHYPANADIWHLRFHWPALSRLLLESVLVGRYRLSPMQVVDKHAIWSAQDAMVLHIDADFAGQPDLYYAHYMDDFIILARTRWRLRRAIAPLSGHLAEGGFSLHPDDPDWQVGQGSRLAGWLV